MEPKKLTRLSADKKLCGVCSGLAKYFDLDPTIARLGFACLAFLTGFVPGIILYVLCAFILPEE